MRALVLLSVCSTYVVGEFILHTYSSRVCDCIIYRPDIIFEQGWRTSRVIDHVSQCANHILCSALNLS